MIRTLSLLLLVLGAVAPVLADVVSYEGASYPENEVYGWERITYCTPQRWLDDGKLFHAVEIGECDPPPGGDMDAYTRSVGAFDGVPAFFAEFRCQTSGDASEFVGRAPAAFDLWSYGPVGYHFTVAKDSAKLTDNDLVTTYADIAAGIPHTFRIEIFGGDWFAWYVDGVVAASGVPTAPYPAYDPGINWVASAYYLDTTTWLDYIRYGDIPADASGDFDSSGVIDGEDFYFFGEYFSGEGVDAGPGARWADFDGDTDVDCADWDAFQAGWFGSASAPIFSPCFGGPIPTISEWGVAIMVLFVLTAATLVFGVRRAPL